MEVVDDSPASTVSSSPARHSSSSISAESDRDNTTSSSSSSSSESSSSSSTSLSSSPSRRSSSASSRRSSGSSSPAHVGAVSSLFVPASSAVVEVDSGPSKVIPQLVGDSDTGLEDAQGGALSQEFGPGQEKLSGLGQNGLIHRSQTALSGQPNANTAEEKVADASQSAHSSAGKEEPLSQWSEGCSDYSDGRAHVDGHKADGRVEAGDRARHTVEPSELEVAEEIRGEHHGHTDVDVEGLSNHSQLSILPEIQTGVDDEQIPRTLSKEGLTGDNELVVVTAPTHVGHTDPQGRQANDLHLIKVSPHSSESRVEEIDVSGVSVEDSNDQGQEADSASIWKSPSTPEEGSNADLSLTLDGDSPVRSRDQGQSSPHPEREVLRTQSMPASSLSHGYPDDLERYRSRTGREGHESSPQESSTRSYEKGDVRRKVAEKISERKKKKILKHLATVKFDGTVEFDVASSTRFADQLFGSSYDRREEISLNGHRVACDKIIRRLQIVMLIVGTRGDVQPFVAIGKRLQEYGHRVRLASHANYRQFVTSSGLEFYPLGGDPKILAGYMVKNKGFLPSSASEISIQRRQMKQICYSLLPACTEPDGANGIPFRAEAIIANPPAYGHVHVAEALKIPIHIFFTMPWTPTSQFPHPLARVSVRSPAAYRLSYQVVDMLIWWGIRSIINNFRRKKLKLRPITYLSGSQGSITNLPTGYIWSPHLVPKPRDWGSQIDVVGFCFLNQATDYKPPDDLMKWLMAGDPPVYIGFGSLPVQDPDGMTNTIVKALEKTHQRGLIDKGWGGMGAKLGPNLPECVYLIENIPHDWLFPRCAAVVHHGGAGTTAAGLRAACPTTIVPFFGDQPFWGERVHEKGVGPAPISVGHFTLDKLVKAIEFMMQPVVKERAVELAKNMENEQGVQGAVEAFHKHLPDMNESLVPVRLPRSFSRKLADAFNQLATCCSSSSNG